MPLTLNKQYFIVVRNIASPCIKTTTFLYSDTTTSIALFTASDPREMA